MPLSNFEQINFLPVLASMHEGVIITDMDGVVRFYNDTQGEIDDLDPEEVIGLPLTEIYQLDPATSLIHQCLSTGKPVRDVTFFYKTHLGKQINILSQVHPLFENKKIIGAVNFSKDYQLLEKNILEPSPDTGAKISKRSFGYRFKDLIGKDPLFLDAVRMAKMSASSPSPVMICGETGTGKEVLAQAVHYESQRKDKPFIPVNCAAIPENLLEGILFGTSRGVFTGAMDKSGLFEKANGGSIFLDELDSMPLTLQAKLLRVVQEKKVRKLGSLSEMDLDIKIISSVSQPPMEIIQNRQLRMDLFYRMGVVTIMLPPLRERPTDLYLLCRFFIEKLNRRLNKRVVGISPDIKELFNTYDWPGNVRELSHCIEGSMNMIRSETIILPRHLPAHIFSFSQKEGFFDKTAAGWNGKKIKTAASGLGLKARQDRDEKAAIRSSLQRTAGNAARAARLIGISPQLLNYKLKKYHIDPKTYKSK